MKKKKKKEREREKKKETLFLHEYLKVKTIWRRVIQTSEPSGQPNVTLKNEAKLTVA